MKIGVHGWRVHARRTGVARYLLNVMRHWDAEQASGDTITFYTPKPLDPAEVQLPASVQQRVLASDWPMLVWENTRLGARASDDVLFCPSYSRPLVARARRHVVATFDAVSKLHPELFPPAVRLFYNPLYGWSARHATLVVAGSEAGRQDVARGFGVPLDRIRAIHLAPAEVFRPGVSADEIEAARMRHVGSGDPFFLFVGKLSGRRSLPPLLNAFAMVKRHGLPHKLLLVGLNPKNLDLARLASEAGVGEELRFSGFIDDAELNRLYNGACAFVMPSVYETLSLPVMEAQATGLPVVCIDTAGMREITGGAAQMVGRLEAEPLADALRTVAEDPDLRERLSREGLTNARRFSWRRCSVETLAAIRDAAA